MGEGVKKRAVFYISGYDLRGARYYHNLYVNESLKQSKVKGYRLKTSPRKKIDSLTYKWSLEFSKGGSSTLTDYHYLDYSELIKKSWPRTTTEILADVIRSYKSLFKTGMLQRSIHWPMYVTAMLPLVILIINLVGAFVVGALLFQLCPEILGFLFKGAVGGGE